MIAGSPFEGAPRWKPRPPLAFTPSIRRILCPNDLSEESDTAMAHVCLIAERFDAELSALPLDRRAQGGAGRRTGAPLVEALRGAGREATRHLEACAARTSAAPASRWTTNCRRIGAVAEAIADGPARSHGMSSHGRGDSLPRQGQRGRDRHSREGGRAILWRRGRSHGPPARTVGCSSRPDLRSRGASLSPRRGGARLRRPGGGGALIPFARASLSGAPQALETARSRRRRDVVRFLQPQFLGLSVTARVELGPGWETSRPSP